MKNLKKIKKWKKIHEILCRQWKEMEYAYKKKNLECFQIKTHIFIPHSFVICHFSITVIYIFI